MGTIRVYAAVLVLLSAWAEGLPAAANASSPAPYLEPALTVTPPPQDTTLTDVIYGQGSTDRAAGTEDAALETSIDSGLDTFATWRLDRLGTSLFEGRRRKKGKRMLLHLLFGMKILGLGIILPSIIALTVFAAWKGITISLMAFMLASIVGIKNLFSKSQSEPAGASEHHVLVSKLPSHHEHLWRADSSHQDWALQDLPYRRHVK